MSKKILDVLICTVNDNISYPGLGALPQSEGVRYVISHQIYNDKTIEQYSREIDRLNSRDDIYAFSHLGKGLSVNRNKALEQAEAEFILIADDDLQFTQGAFDAITTEFRDKPLVDVITFRIKTPEGVDKKNYSQLPEKHSVFTLFKVSSVEIAARRESVTRAKVRFDEDFGLNAKYPSCEEIVFLTDLQREGLQIHASEEYIVIHEQDSSGANYSKKTSILARGALFRKVFGYKGITMCLVFAIKHYQEYKNHFSFMSFLSILLSAYTIGS